MIELKCQSDDECLQKIQIRLGCSACDSIKILNYAKRRANERGTLLNDEVNLIIKERKKCL